jgi:ankyrin repeat protein
VRTACGASSRREAGDAACVELLLRHRATVRGTGALGLALASPELARLVLEHGDLRPTDPELRDALLVARAPAVGELLIAHGAALDARDADGLTPSSHAARFRNATSLGLLLAAGAGADLDPAAEWVGAVVRGDRARADAVRARHPGLVLRRADAQQLPRWASAGEDEVVGRLLDAGVPLDARGLDDGTALHFAGH